MDRAVVKNECIFLRDGVIYGHLMEKMNVRSAKRLAMTVFGESQEETGSKMVANSEMKRVEDSKSLISIAPGEIRTHDPRIRNPVLYPTELRGHT